MSLPEAFPTLVSLAFVAGVTICLVLFAERVALVDDGTDARERKLQRRAVPLVGGLAIAVVVLLVWTNAPPSRCGMESPWTVRLPQAIELVRVGYGALALLGALAIGVLDDVAERGLRPAFKFAGQVAIAVLCARHAHELSTVDFVEDATRISPWLAFFLALLAMNAFNTFDNADGAATALGALGLFVLAPLAAAPLLGFLPFNLWVRRKSPDGSTTPLAYLGDAGSHFLGVLVALVPGAWPVLALPLLDLARLSMLRWKRGGRPWIGDRRHLAHRLQARGFGPTLVVLLLLLVAAPSVLAASLSGGAPSAVLAGLLGTALLYVLAVRATPEVP